MHSSEVDVLDFLTFPAYKKTFLSPRMVCACLPAGRNALLRGGCIISRLRTLGIQGARENEEDPQKFKRDA